MMTNNNDCGEDQTMIDTLAVANTLKLDGCSKPQGEGMTKMLGKLTGDLATKADLDNAMRDFLREMKLWFGGALIVTVAAVGTIVALVVNVSTLTGSP